MGVLTFNLTKSYQRLVSLHEIMSSTESLMQASQRDGSFTVNCRTCSSPFDYRACEVALIVMLPKAVLDGRTHDRLFFLNAADARCEAIQIPLESFTERELGELEADRWRQWAAEQCYLLHTLVSAFFKRLFGTEKQLVALWASLSRDYVPLNEGNNV